MQTEMWFRQEKKMKKICIKYSQQQQQEQREE